MYLYPSKVAKSSLASHRAIKYFLKVVSRSFFKIAIMCFW